MASGPALAQNLVPQAPVFQAIDANGVDVLNLRAVLDEATLSVGPSGQGLKAVTAWDSRAITPYDVNSGRIHFDPDQTTMTLNYEGRSKVFAAWAGGFYDPMIPDGSTLVRDNTQWTYTAHDGTVVHYAGFNPFTPNWPTRGIRDSALTQIVRPDGEMVNFEGMGGYQPFESSLGYRVEGAPANGQVGRNLACAGICDAYTVQSAQALGRARIYEMPGSSVSNTTLVVHNPAGGAVLSYVMRPWSAGRNSRAVISFNNGVATWTYTYADVCSPGFSGMDCPGTRTVTVTDPVGHTRVVTSMLDGPVLTDQDGEGHVTTYSYDQFNRLIRVIYPEGNAVAVVYENRANITALWSLPKGASATAAPDTVPGATAIRAAYPAGCDATNYKICNQPDWVRDARGNQTDFTYDPTHGGVLTVTKPAPVANGVRPQTRYSYGQFTARYYKAGVLTAAAPVWRLTQTSTCQTLASCAGTADETVISYVYEPSNAANNVRLLSTTTRSGDSALVATTSYTYDARGDVTAIDGPLPGTADTTRSYYDASRWRIGVIGPDPDGPSGALLFRANRTTYRADGQVTLTETGTATSQSDGAMSSFAPLAFTRNSYGSTGQVVKVETGQP